MPLEILALVKQLRKVDEYKRIFKKTKKCSWGKDPQNWLPNSASMRIWRFLFGQKKIERR